MRLPVKSETDAFRLAWGSVLLIGLSLAAGALLSPVAGIALFVGAVLGAIAWDLLQDDRAARLSDAARSAPAGGDGRPRILVVANETMGGRELREELLRRGGARPELRVVAPVLPSRAHYIASDIDRELAEARGRLEATLDWARAQGLDATGRVGDDTPLTSIEDELRSFQADELIVSTHPRGRSRWLETGLVERAREELDIPVTHVVVDLENQEVQISGADAAPQANL